MCKAGEKWIYSQSLLRLSFKQVLFYEDSVVTEKNGVVMYLTNFLEVRQAITLREVQVFISF
jgi:hypothetical protein